MSQPPLRRVLVAPFALLDDGTAVVEVAHRAGRLAAPLLILCGADALSEDARSLGAISILEAAPGAVAGAADLRRCVATWASTHGGNAP